MLATSAGEPILWANEEPIVLTGNMEDIAFRVDGSVMVTRNGVSAVEGRLGVIEAVWPRMLESAGANRFRLPEGIEPGGILQQVDAQIVTGTLESSNVDLAREMTELQIVQRA
ncbi:flagellar basal body rod C-terminal domain-containing protein [Halobacillus sp. Marseille-Q1614]|uniref:flagellar basal body rod C-terminal domain-containing protein n=1 Tax=Halobacillus sp. Marseille-Q1614 TaxID=2709134 RepID=UPI0015712977|nr:flagellar basal body rod C-terminal domain-containing protein [Halobacillus sp. Marseille-Q1614]